jgi:hypothetical protein
MKKDAKRAQVEAELDRELEQTFPASDPPSITQPLPHENDHAAPPKRRAAKKE